MNNKALKAWLDAVRIDDVRRRIERIERTRADPRLAERLEDRGGPAAEPPAEPARERRPGD